MPTGARRKGTTTWAVIIVWTRDMVNSATGLVASGNSETGRGETPLYDCMIGDQTLFQRNDFVEAGWRAIMPILAAWSKPPEATFPN